MAGKEHPKHQQPHSSTPPKAEGLKPASPQSNLSSEEDQGRRNEVRERTYLEERRSLADGEKASSDQFDKTIITLAGGALGISVVFLEKIAPTPLASSVKYLCMSWGCLVTSLLVTLASFRTSVHAHRRQIEILEADVYPEHYGHQGGRNYWGGWTHFLNWFSIISFIFGVSLLLYFSVLNISHSPQVKKEMKEQEIPKP